MPPLGRGKWLVQLAQVPVPEVSVRVQHVGFSQRGSPSCPVGLGFRRSAQTLKPPARPRTTHFAFAPFPALRCPALLPAAASWPVDATEVARMQGRRGHHLGPHRGQGSRRVALGDLRAMRLCRSLASRDSRTYRTREESAPTLHTQADLYTLPPVRRATLPGLQQQYIFRCLVACVHMRHSFLASSHCPSCSSGSVLLLGT